MRLLSSLRTIHASLYVLLTILIVSAQPLAGSETGAFELEGELRSADLQVRARAAMERINQSMIRTDYAAVPVYLAILHEAAIQSGNPLINAQWNLQQARLLIANGERVNALPFAEAARGIANSLGEAELEVDALRTLGNIFIQMHDYTQALTYLGEAVAVARTISDRNRIATVLNSMAICFWRVRDWHQAENYLLQALEYYLEDERMRLLFENNIGVALMEQGRYDEALERFYRALEANRIAGHSYSQSLNYSNLGDLYQRMGNTSLARPYLERSLEMAEQFSLDYVALRSSRHWGLMLAKEGDVEGAIEYARRALQIAITSGDRAEELESLEALITITSRLVFTRMRSTFSANGWNYRRACCPISC
ncbi:MAG: tetratricopeptide repeat protein [Verrucomicrobia bacterium]|nr:tetratricopeptide repeat protein [Verrucomicrobiota bacterium]